jgi:hypothetical protein
MGCAHVPQHSESVKRAGIEASDLELRTATVALGRDFLREIETAGDSIEAQTKDVAIRRNSLQWKLSSVSAIEEAVLREDPVISMVDLTAFRGQTRNFLDSPAGAETFGADLPIAQRALARVETGWSAAADSAGVHLSDANRDRLIAWVRAHPIERVPFTRATLAGGLAHTLRDEDSSIGAAVGGMQASLDRLEFRVGLMNEFGVKQATWLSQLAALDLSSSPQAADLTGTLGSTREFVERAPDLVRGEREAVLEDVDRQRVATIRTLLAAVANERTIALSTVDEQRRRAMVDVDSLRVRLVADEIRVVDHLVLRLAELAGALVIVAGAGLLLTRRPTVA